MTHVSLRCSRTSMPTFLFPGKYTLCNYRWPFSFIPHPISSANGEILFQYSRPQHKILYYIILRITMHGAQCTVIMFITVQIGKLQTTFNQIAYCVQWINGLSFCKCVICCIYYMFTVQCIQYNLSHSNHT